MDNYGPPPAYRDVMAQEQRQAAHGDNAPLLGPHTHRTPQPHATSGAGVPVAGGTRATQPQGLQRGPTRTVRHNYFSMTKFVMLWSGSGRPICLLCSLIYLAFFAFGGAIIYFTIEAVMDDLSQNETIDTSRGTTVALCFLSGVTFILLCCSWCWTLYWTQCSRRPRSCRNFCSRSDLDEDRNYFSVPCCFWLAAVLFLCCATGLLVDYLNKNSDIDVGDIGTLCTDQLLYCVSFWVFVSMWVLTCMFASCNALCYPGPIRKITGELFH